MRRLGMILACTVLVLSAPPAFAKKKKTKSPALGPVVTVSAQGNLAAAQGARSTAIAACPPGTVAIGGGFTAPFSAAAAIGIDNSFRSSNESWQVSGENFIGSAAVTAHAYCRRNSRPIADVTGTAAIPGAINAVASATASCPGGSQLIGGGFQTTRGPTATAIAFPFVNMQTGPGTWTVSSANNTNNPQTVTAHAYCMSGIKTPAAVTGSAASAVPVLGPVSAFSAACPTPPKRKKKGKKALTAKKKRKKQPQQVVSAGGYFGAPPTGSSPFGIFTDSRAGTGVWLATAVNGTPFTGSLLLTSQAVCV